MNKPPRGDFFRRENAHFEMLKVTAQFVPNLTVRIKEGSTWINGVFVEYIGGSSPYFNIPDNGAKWVLVYIDKRGKIGLKDGEISANPNIPPELENDQMPLAMVFIQSTTEKITNDMIYDVRPIMDSYYILNHNLIEVRDEIDSHPINSITGLTEALDEKVNHIQFLEDLSQYALNEGTNESEFTFNMGFTGTPSTDMILWVNRGNLPKVGIRWNETTDRFEYTNDGVEWNSIGIVGAVADAKQNVKGLVKLSIDPDDDPIAVGDNDPRILAVANKSELGHTHMESEITDLDKYTKNEVDTKLNGKSNTGHTHTISELSDLDVYSKSEMDGYLSGKADSAHNHTESEITDLDKYTRNQVDSLISNIKYLTTGITKVIYVDGNRTDTFAADGSLTKPYKTITEAMSKAVSGMTVHVMPGTYLEDIIAPAGVSLTTVASNQVIVKGDASFAGGGFPTTIYGIVFSGTNKTVVLNGKVTIIDSTSYSKVTLGGEAQVTAYCFDIKPIEEGVVALTDNTIKNTYFTGSKIESKGNISAILHSSGNIYIDNCELVSEGTNKATVLCSGGSGRVFLNNTKIFNDGGGVAINLMHSAGIQVYPNSLQNLIVKGNINCGERYTLFEGVYQISGDLAGNKLHYRQASHIGNDSSLTGDTVKEVVEGLNVNKLGKNGINGTFTTVDGKTVTVVDGQVISII